MPFTSYKGLQRNTASSGAGGVALDSNFTEIADRIGVCQYASVINPSYADDSSVGFSKGSRWINTVSKRIFDCIDPTVGAAIWVDTADLKVFRPETYGARSDDTRDDTAEVQAAIADAVAVAGKVQLTGPYKITDEIIVSGACTIEGTGCHSLFGSRATWGSDVAPTVSPYLSGTVLRQMTGGKNGLKITAVGESVHLRNFGIRFDDAIKFRNTGYGIECDPGTWVSPSTVSYRQNGIMASEWTGLKVHGHDGNHYGYRIVNMQLCSLNNLQSYGGGGIEWEVNTTGFFGNSTLINPYVFMIARGTSMGYYLKATHGSPILFALIRPQTFIVDALPEPSADFLDPVADLATWYPNDLLLTHPTDQAGLFVDDGAFGLHLLGGDLERMSNSESIRLPSSMPYSFIANLYAPGSALHGIQKVFGKQAVDSLSIGGFDPLIILSSASLTTTTSFQLVPGLTTITAYPAGLPAGTYRLTAHLRFQQASSNYGQAIFTDGSGTQIVGSPLKLIYGFEGSAAQGEATLETFIIVNSPTTIQVRARCDSGAGAIAQDSAGDSDFMVQRIG